MKQLEFDLIIVGAGISGFTSAIAAAKNGLENILLIDQHSKIGGLFTNSCIGTFCGYYSNNNSKPEFIGSNHTKYLIETLENYNSISEPILIGNTTWIHAYDTVILPFILDKMLCCHKNIMIALCFHINNVICDDRFIVSVAGQNLITGEAITLKSKYYIDASGEAALLRLCKNQTIYDSQQSASTLFSMANISSQFDILSSEDIEYILKTESINMKIDIPRTKGTFRRLPNGLVRANIAAVKMPYDRGTFDLTKAEVAGRDYVMRYFNILKNKMPGFQNAVLVEIGQMGIREGHKIKGRYVLNKNDICDNGRFNDAIGLGTWGLEMHGKEVEWNWLPQSAYYQIPYSALTPVKLENVLGVGRCISATTEAMSSLRVAGPSSITGEVAGIAATAAFEENIRSFHNIGADKLNKYLNKNNILVNL